MKKYRLTPGIYGWHIEKRVFLFFWKHFGYSYSSERDAKKEVALLNGEQP